MSVDLLASGLVKTFRDGERETQVLGGADLAVEAGEMVAIVGPSGSDKATLLHILGGLDRADQGEVRVGGESLAGRTGAELAAFRNRTIGFVFQFHQLLPDFTALENVMLPGRIAGREPRESHDRAAELLGEVGLGDRLDHLPGQLSGGERQRVALCRALALDPPLLLADEPTGNLDPASGERVLDLLLRLKELHGTTGVMVTHNPEVAERCARILVLQDGILRSQGPEP
jgi:lipoprotein-releasing system ATP-binding protein